jgi:hypothetical protein
MRRRFSIALALSIFAAAPVAAQVGVAYQYRLSNFSGVIPYSAVQMFADRYHDEVYVGEGDSIRVFNSAGMEIYEFTHDAMKLGSVLDINASKNGDIRILSYCPGSDACAPGALVSRYDYRGDLMGTFALTGLPDPLREFIPNRMVESQEKLVFASTTALHVVITDLAGAYQSDVDLLAGVEASEKARDGAELGGFGVGRDGAFLYTIPTAFRAFRRKPDGTSAAWGKPGSGPGSFGVTGAIVEDDNGNFLVADRSRSVVIVFSPNLIYLKEFGTRGPKDGRLVRPAHLAIGAGGKLYVSQLAMRGVAVFSLTPE